MFNALLIAVALTVTSAPAAKVEAKKPAKTLVCGTWQDSAVGGSYKRCEWK